MSRNRLLCTKHTINNYTYHYKIVMSTNGLFVSVFIPTQFVAVSTYRFRRRSSKQQITLQLVVFEQTHTVPVHYCSLLLLSVTLIRELRIELLVLVLLFVTFQIPIKIFILKFLTYFLNFMTYDLLFLLKYEYLSLIHIFCGFYRLPQKIPLLKYQMLQVNYPFPLTDLHQKQQVLSTLQNRSVCKNCQIQFEFAAVIVSLEKINRQIDTQTHRQTCLLYTSRCV